MTEISLMNANNETLLLALAGKIQIVEPGGNRPALKLTAQEKVLFEKAKEQRYVLSSSKSNVPAAYRNWCWINQRIYTYVTGERGNPRSKHARITIDLGYGRLQVDPNVKFKMEQLIESCCSVKNAVHFSDSDQIVATLHLPREVAESLAKELDEIAEAHSHRNPIHFATPPIVIPK